jgi:hypothetical protein
MSAPLNYIPGPDAADLFEQAISAIMLAMVASGAPGDAIDRHVDSLRAGFDRTRLYLRDIERGARRRNPFPGFRVVRFRRAMASKIR